MTANGPGHRVPRAHLQPAALPMRTADSLCAIAAAVRHDGKSSYGHNAGHGHFDTVDDLDLGEVHLSDYFCEDECGNDGRWDWRDVHQATEYRRSN